MSLAWGIGGEGGVTDIVYINNPLSGINRSYSENYVEHGV